MFCSKCGYQPIQQGAKKVETNPNAKISRLVIDHAQSSIVHELVASFLAAI